MVALNAIAVSKLGVVQHYILYLAATTTAIEVSCAPIDCPKLQKE